MKKNKFKKLLKSIILSSNNPFPEILEEKIMEENGLIKQRDDIMQTIQHGTIYVSQEMYDKYGKEILNKLNGTKNAEIIINEKE